MKSLSTSYTTLKTLHLFLEKHLIVDSKQLLIQIFTTQNNLDNIRAIQSDINSIFSKAAVIGCTTDGSFSDGHITKHQTLINFTSFEHIKLEVSSKNHKADGLFSGKAIAKDIVKDDTKLMIVFASGFTTNGDELIKGLLSTHKRVSICGGLSSGDTAFKKSYTFTKDTILECGAVAVALSGDKLHIFQDHGLGWENIGKVMTVTKAIKNRIYTIDDQTTVDIYRHYLGEELANNLPFAGIEFPLVVTKDGLRVSHSMLTKHDDNSVSFGSNFKVGEKVQFGYGNHTTILNNAKDIFDNIQKSEPQAIFTYINLAKKYFCSDLLKLEMSPLQTSTASSMGCFTNGEFSNDKFLSQTLSVVSLREEDTLLTNYTNKAIDKAEPKENMLRTLTSSGLINLINTAAREVANTEAQNNFEHLFENAPDGIILLEQNQILKCNKKMIEIFGYDNESEFIKTPLKNFFPSKQNHDRSTLIMIGNAKREILQNGFHNSEWILQKKNRDKCWFDVILTKINLNNKSIIYGVYRDISERKDLEFEIEKQKENLFHQANHDGLTRLPNRVMFMQEIKKEIKKDIDFAILFIDLDRFKGVNDTLGHNIGDELLQIVAKRLLSTVRKDDIVARIGGDEFAIMSKNITSNDMILSETRRISKKLNLTIGIKHYTLHTSASIGISRYRHDSTSPFDLIKFADIAMYKAKHEGGNNAQFFTIEMLNKSVYDFSMEEELHRSLEDDNFEVYYQPQYNSISDTIIGLEALVRWNHPTKGLLGPDTFIELAKKVGLLLQLDFMVMEKSMSAFKQWIDEDLKPNKLALNVSMKQLEYSKFISIIKKNLVKYSFEPSWLELEITETEMMQDPDKVIPTLNKLHDMGISIAIDDFGTGYSSLSHLKHLPINKIKIDRAFILDTPYNKDAVSIVKTIIALSESLGINVLAEGVEDIDQKDFLIYNKCTQVQGYLYSKPIPEKEMRVLLLEQ